MDYRKVYRESMEESSQPSIEEMRTMVSPEDFEKYIKGSERATKSSHLGLAALKYKFMFNEASDYIYQNGGDFEDFLEYLDACNYSGLDEVTSEELKDAWRVADKVTPRDFAEENRKHYEDEGFYEWDE